MSAAPTLTAWLRREHDAFRVILHELQAEHGGGDAAKHLRRLLPALAGHERVERELLYPALIEHVKPLDPRLIDAFEAEHVLVHEKIQALREALADRDAGLGRLVAVAEFIGLLREHMEDEEQTLFKLVEQRVPRAALVELGARAAKAAGLAPARGRR